MYFVYRYIDIIDDIIKYVGITCDLDRRIKEHSNELKFQGYKWNIEYIIVDSYADAFDLETYLIQVYDTCKYLNVMKSMTNYSAQWDINQLSWNQYVTKYDSAKAKVDSIMFPGFTDTVCGSFADYISQRHNDIVSKYVGRIKLFDDGCACKVVGIDDGFLLCEFGPNNIQSMSLNKFNKRKGHLM